MAAKYVLGDAPVHHLILAYIVIIYRVLESAKYLDVALRIRRTQKGHRR